MKRAELLERWPTMTERDRDAEVALAKGWTQVRTHAGWEGVYGIPPGATIPVGVPPYSTSWADAGGLLDALLDYLREEHGFEAAVSIDTHDRFYPGMRWEVVFTPGPPEERQVALGTTAPEALSLAYCLAKAEEAPGV